MNLQQYNAANPIPVGVTLYGNTLKPILQVQVCQMGKASEMLALANAAFAAATLSGTVSIVDGDAFGDQIEGLPPASNPPLAVDYDNWMIRGVLTLTEDIVVPEANPLGSGVLKRGMQVTVSEYPGLLAARLQVNSVGAGANTLDGAQLDQNHLVGSEGQWIMFQNGFGVLFDLTGGAPAATLFCRGQ